MNAFFFIGLDWYRLTNLFTSRSVRFVDYQCSHWHNDKYSFLQQCFHLL